MANYNDYKIEEIKHSFEECGFVNFTYIKPYKNNEKGDAQIRHPFNRDSFNYCIGDLTDEDISWGDEQYAIVGQLEDFYFSLFENGQDDILAAASTEAMGIVKELIPVGEYFVAFTTVRSCILSEGMASYYDVPYAFNHVTKEYFDEYEDPESYQDLIKQAEKIRNNE